jgi:hypothetical protein
MRTFNQLDLSGAVQIGTSHLLRKRNEVEASKNATYNAKIGSAKRRDGYEKVARTIEHGNNSLGAIVYRYGTNSKVIVGINNTAQTQAELRVLDTADYWTTILTGNVNTRFQMLNDLDELYVAGASDNQYQTLTNINSSLTASTSHNVYGAPACKFIAEYNSELYAINCVVGGKYYPDRFYKSSPPLGAITFVQTDQKGLLLQLRVDSTRYLKVGMSVDIYGAGTEAKKQSGITIISVDKKNERISFAATAIDVSDNDEIWLTGTKGTLSRFWNTDYKTPETADWDRVPPGKEARPSFTGHGKNNNRLFLFTKNSFLKWDGANLITVSDTIGCVSHETIQNIGSWTLWLHTTGVWGYNDNTGQLKLLSRAVELYIRAINQSNLDKSSAGVVGRVYKVAVGELLPLDSVTTSTSTSSTSTSSTSTSTSSTSTSSTSTSSTSSSTSTTSTSTSISSTSTSVSSTSVSSTSRSTSSTSTSVSTSTSSTTTTTALSAKKVIRLCYDFDLNAWWTEEHKREIRFQFNHNMSGYTKPYFTDETGRLFRDETTNLDNADPIPLEIEFGRNNFGTDQVKTYHSVLIDSENARGALLQYSIDDGKFETLGQITDPIQKLVFPQGGQLIEGRDINYKVVDNTSGDPTVINGLTSYYNINEKVVNEQK